MLSLTLTARSTASRALFWRADGVLPEWLVAASASGRRPENDLLLIGGKTEVALSTVVPHLNDRVRFTADLLDVVFIEK